ncbi:hypothetical protein ZIOFF_032451 [Zingiber officinale]|uniref:Inhibitor I9 domain-containing protein n=2 Tax=Zingiber officinale TaxID=94328 RepID=A0A8J5L6E8_ZINOF|nr:hypothetical protein ZIOFF_032451 [Zingiber officinale]
MVESFNFSNALSKPFLSAVGFSDIILSFCSRLRPDAFFVRVFRYVNADFFSISCLVFCSRLRPHAFDFPEPQRGEAKEMGNKSHVFSPFFLLVLLCFQSVLLTLKASSDKIYIVHVREGESKHEDPEELVMDLHIQILTSVLGSKDEAISSIVYSYGFCSFFRFSSFAAKLSVPQAKKIKELPEVLGIRPSRTLRHLTTSSWDILGVDNSELSGFLRANHGKDIISGVIDSGVWPEVKNFSDGSYSPVPVQWKGKCMPGQHFDVHKCNRRLIGAYYYKGGVTTKLQKGDYLSATGNNVSNVDVYQMPGLPLSATTIFLN